MAADIKKVLVITRWFPNEVEPTRCIFVKNLIDAQSSRGDFHFTVICPTPYFPKINLHIFPRKWIQLSQLMQESSRANYTIYRPRYFKFPNLIFHQLALFTYTKAVLKIIRKKTLTFDIIHAHGVYPDSIIAHHIGRRFSVPVVVHIHESYFIEKVFQKNRRAISRSFAMAKSLICVSEFQQRIICQIFPQHSNKINIVYNGVDTTQFRYHGKANGAGAKRIVFVGNMVPVKGLDILLRAVSIMNRNSVTLDLFGNGSCRHVYQAMVRDLGIQEVVNFNGSIDNTNLPRTLQNYSLFVLPSRYETFGIVLVEALCCGLPVVATNVGAIPEIITPEVGIIVPSEDSASLAKAMTQALCHTWNYAKICEHGRKYSLDATASKTAAIYREKIGFPI